MAQLNSRRFVDIQGFKTNAVQPLYNGHLIGTEESSHCREVETRVNEWTVHQKNCHCREVAVVERWPSVDARLYSEVSYT